MDLKSNITVPVLTDSPPINNARLGIYNALYPYSPPGTFLNIPRNMAWLLDEVRSNSWLDAMQASSPTHRKKNKDSCNLNDPTLTEDDVAYRNWMINYPSALVSFEKITNFAKGKRIALFLDYDGTLSPIVDNPDHAFMSNAMRAAVKSVAKYFPTAIISGRSRDKVFEFVGLTELYYAGSHGMDIMSPVRSVLDDLPNSIKSTNRQGKEVNLFQPASEFLPMIDEVFRSLIEITKDIEGANVENNKFCLSVHYRNVDEKFVFDSGGDLYKQELPVKSWTTIAERVEGLLEKYPSLRLTHGRKVLEVRPVLDWDKGKAVEFLLESLGLSNCEDVLPIYIGDDRTDEDAFKVLRKGNRGYGILVSSAPKESNAFFSLKDPSEVLEFLNSLVMSKKSSTL